LHTPPLVYCVACLFGSSLIGGDSEKEVCIDLLLIGIIDEGDERRDCRARFETASQSVIKYNSWPA